MLSPSVNTDSYESLGGSALPGVTTQQQLEPAAFLQNMLHMLYPVSHNPGMHGSARRYRNRNTGAALALAQPLSGSP